MKPAWVVVMLAGGCAFDHQLDGDATQDHTHGGAWLEGFAQREQIALAAGTVTHAAIPQFVASITAPADPARAGSPQIAFTGEDGKTPLPAEILAFDHTTGAFDAWIATPLATGRDTHVYVYFDGMLAATPANDPVWDPTMFAASWHMDADAQGIAVESVAANNAMPGDVLVPGVMPGMAGNARDYNGSLLSAVDSAAYRFDVAHSFAYAMWVNTSAANTGYDMPFNRGGFSSDAPGYDVELGTNNWNFSLVDDTGAGTLMGVGDNTTLQGAWHQIAAVIDREHAQLLLYLDGAAVTVVAPFTAAGFANTAPVLLGVSDYPFTGLLDEVRIYATAPSSDWFAVEYANLAHRDTFVTIGVSEPR